MQRTKIEYLTHTWNPLAMECTPLSDGCRNCWHLAMAKRLVANPRIVPEFRNAYGGVIPPVLIHTELEAPLHLKNPSRIGVQLMGDLFHEEVKFNQIEKIWDTIFNCSFHQDRGQVGVIYHTFLILTKRPNRVIDFQKWMEQRNRNVWYDNLWLGVSVEDQKTADERIPILLQIPAAHRFVSVEPMLVPVDLRRIDYMWLLQKTLREATKDNSMVYEGPGYLNALSGEWNDGEDSGRDGKKLDWVICGGETGPKARPLPPDWVRLLVEQCRSASVPIFVKQMGGDKKKNPIPKDLIIREFPEGHNFSR